MNPKFNILIIPYHNCCNSCYSCCCCWPQQWQFRWYNIFQSYISIPFRVICVLL